MRRATKIFAALIALATLAGCAQVNERMFTVDCAIGRTPLAGRAPARDRDRVRCFDQPYPTVVRTASRDRAMRQCGRRHDDGGNSGRHGPEPTLNATEHGREPRQLRAMKNRDHVRQPSARQSRGVTEMKIRNFLCRFLCSVASLLLLAGCAQQGGGLLQPTPKEIISGKNTIVPSAAALSMEATNFCNAQAQVDYAGSGALLRRQNADAAAVDQHHLSNRDQPVLVPGVRLHELEQSADRAADGDAGKLPDRHCARADRRAVRSAGDGGQELGRWQAE